MPTYSQKIKGPSREEYKLWQELGYLGTWEQYSDAKSRNAGGTVFITGELGAHCTSCMAVGDYLCDYPVGEELTCDRPICDRHAHEVGQDIHYCDGHHAMWTEFKAKGGVVAALKNVIAFKSEK